MGVRCSIIRLRRRQQVRDHNMALPNPVSNTDVFLMAVINKLEEIRVAVIDVESELQKLNAATQSTPAQKTVIQLDAKKISDAINQAIAAGVSPNTKAR